MTAPRDPLLLALDRVDAPVRFFVRDDDAGWDEPGLMALLDTMADTGLPIDLAVIPQALTDTLASRLQRLRARQPLGLHQHGWAHANHEMAGRKCEFGSSRPSDTQRADVEQGQRRMRQAFGGAADPIFTPPWNRCADSLPAQLAARGFAALSRDSTAPPQHALADMRVHTDWCKQWRLACEAGADADERIAADLALHVKGGGAVGLMLHHAAMGDDARLLLRNLLMRWSAHPLAHWISMRDLLTKATA